MATIQFSITVPDDKRTMIIDAFCAYHGYTDTILDPDGNPIPNPETQAAFAKRMVIKFIRESVKAGLATLAAEAARQEQIVIVDEISMT